MKTNIIPALITMLAIAVSCSYAQEFTLTTTAANTVSSKSSIDMPGLTGNPLAIIVATPVGNTALLNPNPIGAWYYSGKWNIFNSNHSVMPIGAKYRVQFVLEPGPNQFLHIVTEKNLGSEGSYIDNPALNNNPGAQLKILQNHSPDVRPSNLNRFQSQAAYSSAAGRWYIANVDGEPMGRASAFNIIISSASGSTPGNAPPSSNPAANPVANVPPVSAPVETPPLIKPLEPIVIGAIPKPGAPSKTAVPPATPPVVKPVETTVPPVTSPVAKPPEPIGPVVNPNPKTAGPTPTPAPVRLHGWVDMHTHPMSHLGFGKKLLHGVPDGSMGANGLPNGSIIPAGTSNCNPTDRRASSIFDALGNCSSTHAGWGIPANPCGDHLRAVVLNRLFDKDFQFRLPGDLFNGGNLIGDHQHQGMDSIPEQLRYWPSQTSKVHQQMWWEWIKRAKEKGHLGVMVALTVNSELLAEVINGDEPKDDKGSADLQLDELKSFVGRHNDFMEIAYTPADLRRIGGEGKLAVILGMEVDNLGNFNKPGAVVNEAAVKAEIQRLHAKGVRYIFPIHLLNNKFGGTAVYEDLFNFANKKSTGSFYTVSASSAVSFRLGDMSDIGVMLSVSKELRPIIDALATIPYPPAFQGDPTKPNFCVATFPSLLPSLGCWKTFKTLKEIINPPSEYQIYANIGQGHVNDVGLTGLGKFAITEMMRSGMMIDIDHMSDRSQADTFAIAERPGNDYPLNIGHNGIRDTGGSERHASENSVERISKLGGLFGIGTSDSEKHHSDANTFISSFNKVWSVMARNGGSPRVAMGTDVNGMERLPRASPGLTVGNFYSNHFYDDIADNLEDNFQQCRTGTRTWDYTVFGVVHYGLMADFVRDVRKRDVSVQQRLMDSAEGFAQMWEKVEKQKAGIQ